MWCCVTAGDVVENLAVEVDVDGYVRKPGTEAALLSAITRFTRCCPACASLDRGKLA
jgi:hypothetical protein